MDKYIGFDIAYKKITLLSQFYVSAQKLTGQLFPFLFKIIIRACCISLKV